MMYLNYVDIFGIDFHFYTKNKRRFHSYEGGILSIIFFFCCLIIFTIISGKDFLHKNPISNSSSIPSVGYKKIKYGEKEKLWIPWRIIDYNEKFINFTGTLYPIIYYYYGEKDPKTGNFPLNFKYLNYKLCNETDFVNRSNSYFIDVPLDQLYCSEINDIFLGGGWTADYMYYIQLDIYLCEDGIEYDNTNKKCTSYEKLVNSFEDNVSWAFEYFYPIVQFQPTNYENPVIVIYKSHFYNFSKFLNKAERIYIQEYTLIDDKSFFFTNQKNSSFWGYISSETDIFYSIEIDPLNETPSSRLYSLSIYLDMGLVLYIRSYNKVFTIIAESFPIFSIVFYVFNFIAYMIKTINIEKNIMELMFEKEVKIKNSNTNDGKPNSDRKIDTKQNLCNKVKRSSAKSQSIQTNSSLFHLRNINNKNNNIKINNYFYLGQNKTVKNIPQINIKNKFNIINNSPTNKPLENTNVGDYISNDNKTKLFSITNYIISFFIKTEKKKYFGLSNDYSITYNFMCDMLDVNSYIELYKKFYILLMVLKEKEKKKFNVNKKININDSNFLRIMSVKNKKVFYLATKNY